MEKVYEYEMTVGEQVIVKLAAVVAGQVQDGPDSITISEMASRVTPFQSRTRDVTDRASVTASRSVRQKLSPWHWQRLSDSGTSFKLKFNDCWGAIEV